MKIITGILDVLANELAGPMFTWRHAAPAIRQFDDVARTPNTQLHDHPEDFELWQFAILDEDDMTVTPQKHLLMSGRQWKAAQPQQQDTQ